MLISYLKRLVCYEFLKSKSSNCPFQAYFNKKSVREDRIDLMPDIKLFSEFWRSF